MKRSPCLLHTAVIHFLIGQQASNRASSKPILLHSLLENKKALRSVERPDSKAHQAKHHGLACASYRKVSMLAEWEVAPSVTKATPLATSGDGFQVPVGEAVLEGKGETKAGRPTFAFQCGKAGDSLGIDSSQQCFYAFSDILISTLDRFTMLNGWFPSDGST